MKTQSQLPEEIYAALTSTPLQEGEPPGQGRPEVRGQSRYGELTIRTCESFNEHTCLRRMWTVCSAMMGKQKDGNTALSLALGTNTSAQEGIEAVGDVFFPQPAKRTDHRVYEPEQSAEADYETDFTTCELEAAIEGAKSGARQVRTGLTMPR